MANVQIPNLPAAIAITGTEQLEAVQGGVSVRLTSAQIAALASPYLGNPLSVGLGGTGLSGGTSGGLLYFDSASSLASSSALTANALMIGGGAGAAPSTTTTGTGVLTALAIAVGSAGALVTNGGALGTPASGTLTNCTGYSAANLGGLGTGVATWLETPSSANLAAAVTGETGSGALVFGTSPTLTTPTLSSPTMTTPVLGTPASGNLSACTGYLASNLGGLGTGVGTWLATPSSANLLAAMTDKTGTGVLVFNNSPAFTTPALGTPASGTLTNCTGYAASSLTGLGTGVASALAVNVGSAGALIVNGGALGTPSSGTLTSCTGLPISTGVSGLGTGVATFLATPSSANLASAITDETGSGALVFGTAPTLTGAVLAAGTISVAPLTFTSGTNLTTAAAGAAEYDGTVFYTSPAASSRGVSPSEYYVVLTSSRTLTNNTSAQAIFAGGGGPASGQITLATGTYVFESLINTSGLSSSSHTVSIGFAGTATIGSILYQSSTSATSVVIQQFTTTTSATDVNGASTTQTTQSIYLRGVVRVTGAGTFIPQITQGTNSAAANVLVNSFFSMHSLGASGATYVGNWS